MSILDRIKDSHSSKIKPGSKFYNLVNEFLRKNPVEQKQTEERKVSSDVKKCKDTKKHLTAQGLAMISPASQYYLKFFTQEHSH